LKIHKTFGLPGALSRPGKTCVKPFSHNLMPAARLSACEALQTLAMAAFMD
jgi:hypothetical protein